MRDLSLVIDLARLLFCYNYTNTLVFLVQKAYLCRTQILIMKWDKWNYEDVVRECYDVEDLEDEYLEMLSEKKIKESNFK